MADELISTPLRMPAEVLVRAFTPGHLKLLLEGVSAEGRWKVVFLGTNAFDLPCRFRAVDFAAGDPAVLARVRAARPSGSDDEPLPQEVHSFTDPSGAVYWIWAASARLAVDYDQLAEEIVEARVCDDGPTARELAAMLASH